MNFEKFEVNEEYLRTSPILKADGTRDYNFCSTPIRILEVNGKDVIYQYTPDSWKGRILKDGPRILPYAYLDKRWEKVSDILLGDEFCALDQFCSGRKVFRKKPLEEYIKVDDPNFGYSFDVLDIRTKRENWQFVGRENAVIMYTATQNNVVVLDADGNKVFLDERYANAADWELYDKPKH